MDVNIQKPTTNEEEPHEAPEKSPEHLALRAAARNEGKDEDTLRDILWLINAHDRLLGLVQIATNLLAILNMQLKAEPSPEDDLAVFRGWREVLLWIVGAGRDPVFASGVNPNFGEGITRHPLYACLWYVSEDGGWVKTRYRLLQWHLLWAHVSYLSKESRRNPDLGRRAYEAYDSKEMWDAFPNSPYPAFLAGGHLRKPGWGALLRELELKYSPEKFVEALHDAKCPDKVQKQLGPSAEEDWHKWREEIRSFLAKANGLEEWRFRTRGPGGDSARNKKRKIWSADATPGDREDPDAVWPTARWVTVEAAERNFKREDILALDLIPDEVTSPEHRYLVEQDTPQQLAVQSALAARGQRRHVQLEHQLLPWQYNQLTLQELAFLLRRCHKTFAKLLESTKWNKEQYRTAELITLIHVMLWTGSSLDRACELVVSTGQDKAEGETPDADIFFEIDKFQWRIRAALPHYASDIPDTEKHAYTLVTFFHLPDIADTESFVSRLLDRRPPIQARVGDNSQSSGERREAGYLFPEDVEIYRNDLSKWLRARDYDASAGDLTGRVTLGRIAIFIFNRLLAITGDLVAAVVITDHSHPQARTQQFYGTYSVSELQRIYRGTTTTVVDQAYKAADLPMPKPVPPPTSDGISAEEDEEDEDYVGARLCARLTCVQDAIRELHKQIGEVSQSQNRAESITFHNLYSLHTVLFFGYATSMRAIWTPYLAPEKVDDVTGFTFISDKDDDAQHKTRPAWVPPLVREQMRFYADHIFVLQLNNLRVRNWLAIEHEPCFFLDPNGKPLHITPTELSKKMRPFLALPPNAHRRFMRHQLLAKGCPPEVVNAWLGHAFQGEEPWGPHSSFSFAEYKKILEHYLLPILEKELGWKALKSPLT